MFIWLNYHFFSPSSYFLSTEPSRNRFCNCNIRAIFSHKYLRNLPNEKKGKRSPGHCLFSVLAFFYVLNV
ncbi:hypothetical protein [Wolbachia endosymbiont of Dactylopius coccus]